MSEARATGIVRKPAVKRERVVDTVHLGHEARARPQGVLRGEGGLSIALALPGGASLNDGDALRLEDGRLVEVRAASERLLEVRAENPARLLRLAWHLGGRHAPVEIGADALLVLNEPAVAELARGQGCAATPVEGPFRPERAEHVCDHDHDHGHDHAHAHAHHGHAHAEAHAHSHGSAAHSQSHSQAHSHSHSHSHADHGDGAAHAHSHDHTS